VKTPNLAHGNSELKQVCKFLAIMYTEICKYELVTLSISLLELKLNSVSKVNTQK
jgi:hypothetical protein